MRDVFLNYALKLIKQKRNYNAIRMAELKYGLHCMYTLITKFIVISFIAFLLGIFKEFLIFMIFYNFLRMQGDGFHANTNLQCWFLSTITFILFPYISLIINIPKIIQLLICFVFSIILIRYAPADTQKRPIINRLVRRRKKILMFIVCLTYLNIITFKNNIFINNVIMFAMMCETIFIIPLTYKIFNQKYANYKIYYREKFRKEGFTC